MIDSFEKVWEKIEGDKKPYTEILEALRDEIAKREEIGHELFQIRDFKTQVLVENERNAFIQVQYGFLNQAFLGEPERLKEIGLDESEIWKTAQAKSAEKSAEALKRT
jgi:hypothetical protein